VPSHNLASDGETTEEEDGARSRSSRDALATILVEGAVHRAGLRPQSFIIVMNELLCSKATMLLLTPTALLSSNVE
jgi:hypothetical protein